MMLKNERGAIGQGLRVMTFSTNDRVGRLKNEAVSRPGHMAAEIECAPLGREESAAWLAARNCDLTPSGAMTLAELFAAAEGRQFAGRSARPLGFRRGGTHDNRS
ncbi:MAG: hypothetical protein IVW36_07180 [Dehalococcoidia bacterium]|nr:hypothetical protein [Dehalococcoidia bacterium]